MEHTEGPWVVNEKHPARSSDAEVIIEQKAGRDRTLLMKFEQADRL